VRFKHLFDLVLILGLDALRQGALVELVPVLGGAAPLLELLERDLEFPGRLVQVLLVGLLLVDEELATPLPERLLLVVSGLGVGKGALQLLNGRLVLHDSLCLDIAVLISLVGVVVEALDLELVLLELLLKLGLLAPLLLIEPLAVLLEHTDFLFELGYLLVELLLNLLECPSLLLILLLPHVPLALDPLDISLALLLKILAHRLQFCFVDLGLVLDGGLHLLDLSLEKLDRLLTERLVASKHQLLLLSVILRV